MSSEKSENAADLRECATGATGDVERTPATAPPQPIPSAQPPPYASPDAPPPSYESLFGKVKQIQNDSSGGVDCMQKTCSWLCGSFFFLILLAFCLSIPIAMLVMGVIYVNRCPVQEMIPLYLIVGGATSGAYTLITLLRQVFKRCTNDSDADEEDSKSHPLWKGFDCLMNTFICAWFFFGSWATFSTWQKKRCPIYECSETEFCNPFVLLFAFWLLISTYICCGCCCCCASLAAAGATKKE